MRGTTVFAAVLFSTYAAADEAGRTGEVEFNSRCAVCHGVDAKGHGVMADYLTVKPPDLTQLSKKNGRMFPYEYVVRVIDGRAIVAMHGTRDMPVWGGAFKDETFDDFKGPMGEFRSEIYVAGRILLLVKYLESIQSE